MIRFILLHNRQGKTRLSKWYVPVVGGEEEKTKIEAEVYRMVVNRDRKYTNFMEYENGKIVYRRYAGLYFSFGISASDNELLTMETIHFFVELLDSYFSNVCELDIVFNFNKVYTILDEFILSGEVEENAKTEILERVHEVEKLE